MEFKSQICTTHEQSKRLLALGLKPETADMVYHHTKSKVPALEWELQTKPPTLRGKFWTPQRIANLHFLFTSILTDRQWPEKKYLIDCGVRMSLHGVCVGCWSYFRPKSE